MIFRFIDGLSVGLASTMDLKAKKQQREMEKVKRWLPYNVISTLIINHTYSFPFSMLSSGELLARILIELVTPKSQDIQTCTLASFSRNKR